VSRSLWRRAAIAAKRRAAAWFADALSIGRDKIVIRSRAVTNKIAREVDAALAKARAVWNRNIDADETARKSLGLCIYCGKPTRRGSALIDGWSAHKSCIAEYEGA
jgi:hypothetical protein